jgi:hypothetical protein
MASFLHCQTTPGIPHFDDSGSAWLKPFPNPEGGIRLPDQRSPSSSGGHSSILLAQI